MSIFTKWFGVEAEAAALPPVPLPKAPTGAQAEPAHRTVVGGTAARINQRDRAPLTTDRLDVRNAANTAAAIRQLSFSSPDISSAIYAALRVGIPEAFSVIARDMDGKVNPLATGVAQELLRRLTYLGNVDGTYGNQVTVQSLSESLGKQLLQYGACSGEVALDKARIPASLNPVSVTTIKWYDEEKGTRPVQVVGGTEINLDIPTFVYVSLDQDQLDAYPASPLEPAIQPVLADLDFNNDIRRALKRAVLPRLVATIDSEAIKKSTPPDVLNDSDKFATYKQSIITAVEQVVNGANPEDAFISFSEISYAYVDGGGDPSAIIERIQKVLNAKLQTGAKTLPVVLGHGGTANAASAESLLFVKTANMLRVKLNEFYSRALTIAVRIMGQDCYVEFKYAQIDLRPDAELEAYKAMKQSRFLELLSLGLMTDEEVAIELTGNLPPAGYKPLMGTMFKTGTGGTAGAAQPGTASSGTSNMDKGKPDTPAAPKSGIKAELELVTVDASADLMQSHRDSLAAVQDMAYTMSRQATKPVEVNVAPTELHLTIAQEAYKSTKTVRVLRGEDGKVSGMEVINGD
jgi:hypothetical protein